MSHFAKIENGIVTKVIVAEPEFFNTFIDDTPGTWIQTSYNTRGGVHYEPGSNHTIPSADQSKALRKNYAGIGYEYNQQLDAFIAPKPFNSWILNETTCRYEAPVVKPTAELEENQYYSWNESILNWEIKTGIR
jgi:hypothetical protein